MTRTTALDRRYQRLLACYPREFRREHEQEMLGVLMAGVREDQRRPGFAESVDLAAGALRMRLRPRGAPPPRSVLGAVRLMSAGALLELAALITIVASSSSVRAAILAQDPQFTASQWHAVLVRTLVPDEVAAPVAIGLWIAMAWASRRGFVWARFVFLGFFVLSVVSVFVALAQVRVSKQLGHSRRRPVPALIRARERRSTSTKAIAAASACL